MFPIYIEEGTYRNIGKGLRRTNNKPSEGPVVHIDLSHLSHLLEQSEDDSALQISVMTKATL